MGGGITDGLSKKVIAFILNGCYELAYASFTIFGVLLLALVLWHMT